MVQWLRQVGFRSFDRHRSKEVTAWRQGDNNLVVNAESDGLAHAHDITHGPAVCAMDGRGMAILPIPGIYYDGLETRFVTDPGLNCMTRCASWCTTAMVLPDATQTLKVVIGPG